MGMVILHGERQTVTPIVRGFGQTNSGRYNHPMAHTGWLILLAGVAAALLIMALAGCGWLWADRRVLRIERDELANQREELKQDVSDLESQLNSCHLEIDQLKTQLAEAQTQLAVATQTHKHVQQQFDHAQKQLREAFDSLASDALAKQSKQFLALANERLHADRVEGAKQLDAAKHQFQSLVKPISETLSRYDASMKALAESRRQAYGSLTKQVELMVADQRHLRQETANLVKALRKPNVRGQWGQVQLRRVVELAGMIPHCDFDEQRSVEDEGRQLRPDMVVNLPNGRSIVVDAKTPLNAYLDALDSQQENDQHQHLQRHAQQVAAKVKELSAKQYHAQFDRSPDFVVLFIPGETFLYAALEQRPELTELAMEQGVVIATPNTLISLLKAVALGWREERIAQHAQRVSDLGRALHQRIAKVMEHAQRLGVSLDQSVKRYNAFIGSFETRVVASARKFEELGAGSAKTLPGHLPEVETHPKSIRGLTAENSEPDPPSPQS